VRLDRDEMAADADDGDAGHATRTYMTLSCPGRITGSQAFACC
jgi:hypothetical protein